MLLFGVGENGDDIDSLVHTDAVNLFVERARRVKADFALTDSNAGAVVEICQRLDGVPLATQSNLRRRPCYRAEPCLIC